VWRLGKSSPKKRRLKKPFEAAERRYENIQKSTKL
jgi:hypothetical protein